MYILRCSLAVLLFGCIVSAWQSTEVSGDYLEVRANKVYGCYCEWSGEAITAGREAILAWGVKSGTFGGVPLAGARFAALIVGEGTLSQEGSLRSSIVFLDAALSKEAQSAVRTLLDEQYGLLLGAVLKTYTVPIECHRDAERASVHIGDVIDVAMRKARLPQDAMRGARRWYEPFVLLDKPTLGTTLKNKYAGHDFSRQWELTDAGVTGYFGSFRVPLP